MLDLAEPKVHVRGFDASRVVASLGDHLGRHVDADDPAGSTDSFGGQKAVEPSATPEIENRLAGLQRGDRLRIAASEAEAGSFGDARKLILRVAERQAAAILGSTTANPTAILTSRDLGVGGSHLGSHCVVFVGVHWASTLKDGDSVERTQPARQKSDFFENTR